MPYCTVRLDYTTVQMEDTVRDIPQPVEDGGALLALRHKLKLAQSQIAVALGLSRNTLNRWEAGDPIPRDRGIALGLLFAWLDLENDAKPKPPGRPAAIARNHSRHVYKTPAGEILTKEQAMQAELGATFWVLSAVGREPSEAAGDEWYAVERTANPSQPFRAL